MFSVIQQRQFLPFPTVIEIEERERGKKTGVNKVSGNETSFTGKSEGKSCKRRRKKVSSLHILSSLLHERFVSLCLPADIETELSMRGSR